MFQLLVILMAFFYASSTSTHSKSKPKIESLFPSFNDFLNNNFEQDTTQPPNHLGYIDKFDLLHQQPDLREFFYFDGYPRILNKIHDVQSMSQYNPINPFSSRKNVETFDEPTSFKKMNNLDFMEPPLFIKEIPREETQLKAGEPIKSYEDAAKAFNEVKSLQKIHHDNGESQENLDKQILKPGNSKSNEHYLGNEIIPHSKTNVKNEGRNEQNRGEVNKKPFGGYKIGNQNIRKFILI
ncbi:uncharacterized protein [Onthophagus taurus]|uniref:uncharacterized protein isoform X2 n=1 Tax=Onthophagus taurus TaxID=166361 RepID=UPI0039BEA93D